jgi:hypothetical protein
MSVILDASNPAPRAGWRRIAVPVGVAVLIGLLVSLIWQSGVLSLLLRTVMLALLASAVFTLFERWPRRLPAWVGRWVLQVVSVALVMPLGTLAIYVLSTESGAPPFWEEDLRLQGFALLTLLGVLIAPWVALGALVRQKEAIARSQALAFELERSELERQALDARLNLLQAQVAPHFLFNTLANVQALVDAGSPRAAAVLRSLVAYLRAAVPRLHELVTTLERELELVQAYLELMHMRMPDRLQYALDVDPAARALRCPPMTLLTLVENAVRHGIDPAEDGGRIAVRVRREGGRCAVHVEDTGLGLRDGGGGLGTGLRALRERLELVFGPGVTLSLAANAPRGTVVELAFPAREARA